MSARLCFPALSAGLLLFAAGTARADDAACQRVLDAILKQGSTPVHQKVSIESAAAPGRPLLSEIIRTNDTLYMQIRGQWMAKPYDPQVSAAEARAAMQKAPHTCTRVRSDAVDGQAADLYSVQSKTETFSTDAQIWISPASGLPLLQRTQMQTGGGGSNRHEVRFDYSNVTPPAGVTR